jgi:transmembrane sensor
MNGASIQPEIRDAAQRWFLRMQSGDCSAIERETFEHWRDANPAHDVAYRAVESVWQRSAALGTDPALGDILRQARRLPPESSWFRRAAPALALAACLMLAIGIGYGFWWLPAATIAPVEYTTVPGQQRTLVLEDGSKVVLDTATQLQVRYSDDERQLTLLQGRADFRVSHDPARPFIVHVDDGSVTATGTRFQVRMAQGIDTVTLLKGQVVVAANDAKQGGSAHVTLQAGERVAIKPGGNLGTPRHLTDTDLASARGWTEGMLVVRDWPLARLVSEMNRYTTTPLRLGDPGLGSLPINGSFKASDQQSFLLALEYGWPIRVDRSTPGEIVLRRK